MSRPLIGYKTYNSNKVKEAKQPRVILLSAIKYSALFYFAYAAKI